MDYSVEKKYTLQWELEVLQRVLPIVGEINQMGVIQK